MYSIMMAPRHKRSRRSVNAPYIRNVTNSSSTCSSGARRANSRSDCGEVAAKPLPRAAV